MLSLVVESLKIHPDLAKWFARKPYSRPVVYIEPDTEPESVGATHDSDVGIIPLEGLSLRACPDPAVLERNRLLEARLKVEVARLCGKTPTWLQASGALLIRASREEVLRIVQLSEVRSVDLSGDQSNLH